MKCHEAERAQARTGRKGLRLRASPERQGEHRAEAVSMFALDVAPWEPSDWPKAYATSPHMSNRSWLWFRGLVLAFFVGHFVAHLIEYWKEEGFMYFIYLSRWTITCEVVQEICYFLVTYWGSILLENGVQPPNTLPTLVKIHMALKCMVLPTCLLSSGLYWAFSPYLPPPYVSAAVHGGDVVAVHLSFFLGRFPYAFNKCGWIIVWGGSFAVWSLIHFLLKIGRDDSAPCDYPSLSECPIYAQLDWHYPVQTGALCLLGVVAGPLLFGGIYTGLTILRDRCDTGAQAMRNAQILIANDELKDPDMQDRYERDQLKCCAKSPLNCGV